MKRMLLSLLLALTMTLSLATTSAFAVSYPDSQDHWAAEAIDRWSDYGMIQGNNGQFAPNGTLTRAHMAAMLCRLLNLPAAGSYGFLDVKDGDWFQDAIDRCAAAGIMLGNNGYANPNSPITREQAMVMLCRALGLQPAVPSALDAFEDADQVSEYARGYLAALVNAGILKGDNGKLNPRSNITRAQMVVIVDRTIGCYANEMGKTVSAENGGIILVTARNVKVINAPEGAAIIVTDSASGLTVNGVKVSSGQTYTVPAAEAKKPTGSSSSSSGGHSHSHSYAEAWSMDTTHHWHACSCGAVADKAEHSYTAYTANKNGTHSRSCSVCGISATSNCNYESTTVDSGTKYTCTVCGDYYVVPTAATPVARVGENTYETLAAAITAATGTANPVVLLTDIEVSEPITITASITINGSGKTLSSNQNAASGRTIQLDNTTTDIDLRLENLKVVAPTENQETRALTFYNNTGKITVTLDNCTLENPRYYALSIASSNSDITVSVKNSTLTGWAALQTWSANSKITVEDSTLTGNNSWPYSAEGNNDFSTIVVNSTATGSDLTFKNCTINAKQNDDTCGKQTIFSLRAVSTITCTGCTFKMNDTLLNGLDTVLSDENTYFEGVCAIKDTETKYNIVKGSRVTDGVIKVDDANYSIYNAAGLKWLADQVNGGNNFKGQTVKLTADIDLNNELWTPIGMDDKPFSGIFDGQNHIISNLTVGTSSDNNVGLFGFTKKAPDNTLSEVKNLTVKNATVTGYLNVGVVAGTPYTTKYTNITVTGHVEVNGYAYVGGVGGKNAYADWTGIKVNADATSYVNANSERYRTYVGGVIGYMGEGTHTMKNVTSNINVTGSTCDVGGIAGIAQYGNIFINCSSSGKVTLTGANDSGDELEIGGILGVWMNSNNGNVTLTDCSFTGTLSTKLNGVDKSATLSDLHKLTGTEYHKGTPNGKLIIDSKEYTVVDKGVMKQGENYLISSAAGLEWLNAFMKSGNYMGTANDNLSGRTFKLTANIDATDVTWTTVVLSAEQSAPGFTFDGNGKTISNLTVSGKGMFCTWANGINSTQPTTIKNITFDKATVTETSGGNGYHIGLIWGELAGDLVLSGVSVKNSSVTGNCNIGALVGRNSGDEAASLKFDGCSVTGCTITATGSGDPNGASAFLGSALTNGHAFTLTFQGTNTQSNNTMNSAANQAGGGVYAAWIVSTNATSVVNVFDNMTISGS